MEARPPAPSRTETGGALSYARPQNPRALCQLQPPAQGRLWDEYSGRWQRRTPVTQTATPLNLVRSAQFPKDLGLTRRLMMSELLGMRFAPRAAREAVVVLLAGALYEECPFRPCYRGVHLGHGQSDQGKSIGN